MKEKNAPVPDYLCWSTILKIVDILPVARGAGVRGHVRGEVPVSGGTKKPSVCQSLGVGLYDIASFSNTAQLKII